MNPALALLVDTTIDGATLGVFDAKTMDLLWYKNHPSTSYRSSSLNTLLGEALEELNASCKNLVRIYVSRGPGSFTGIKIGLAFAHGLQAGNNQIELVGFSSLEVLAQHDAEKRAFVLPATKVRGAAAVPQLIDVDISHPPDWPVSGVVLLKPWPTFLDATRTVKIFAAELELVHRKVLALVAKNNDFSVDLSPLYLRTSTAEEKLIQTDAIKCALTAEHDIAEARNPPSTFDGISSKLIKGGC